MMPILTRWSPSSSNAPRSIPRCCPSRRPAWRWRAFGDSALLFNLRVSLPDIDKAGDVQSDLRIAILKALRAAGIEIPFNHLDVTLRDVETMRRYLDEVLERPKQKSEIGNQKSEA